MTVRAALLAVAIALAAILAAPEGYDAVHAGGCDSVASPSNAQSRIDAAGAGDVVCLEPGVFRGRLIVGGKSGVTLRGAGKFNTIVSGGSVDAIVIVDSSNVTVERMTLYQGAPANVYIGRSSNVVLRDLDVGGGEIGVHVDDGSSATIADSFIYAMRGDGVLIRRGSSASIERNWIFYNGVAGVSAVGHNGAISIVRNIISDHRGPGVFAGVPPCANLPGASLNVPACFYGNPGGYVSGTQLVLDTNVIQASGSTGVVLFPGVSATMRGNRFWRNRMTGLFAWGASFTSSADEYDGNEEHAIEVRGYLDPRAPGAGYIRPSASIDRVLIRNTTVYAPTGTLGGGVIVQGAHVDLTNALIYFNASIGVSYQNGASGRVDGSTISDNGGGAVCIGAASVAVGVNTIFGNATDKIGAC
jgi:hypothetical protein